MLLSLCFFLILGQPAVAGVSLADAPKEYSPSLSFVHDSPDTQTTEYILALDSSGSMRDSVDARNAAAAALIRSLPYENTRATAFFFSNACEIPLEILPMDQENSRQELTAAVEGNISAQGGTDLGLMMRTAIDLFSDKGADPSVQHVLFVVTDGQSDGEGGLAEARDEEFFSLCRAYQETVDTYIVDVSDGELPSSLCTGLQTEPIMLGDSGSDTLDACTSQLAAWDKGELAKVLSISDIDLLETALLLLRFSNESSVFHRVAEKDTIVSFRIPPLCTQQLLIALSGGASVRDTLSDLRWEKDGETDLLRTATVGADPSVATINREQGLPPGLYTMAVKTSAPISIVFTCRYNFKIRFGLAGWDRPLAPPAGSKLTLQMQLLAPDGTPLEEDDTLMLSMNIYRQLEDGTFQLYTSVENNDTFSTAGLEKGECLRFYPVAAYSGVVDELDSFWEVCLSEETAAPVDPLPDASVSSPIIEESPTRSIMPLVLVGLIVLLLSLYLLVKWIRQRQKVKRELQPTGEFIHAGIRWKIVEKKNEHNCLLGGIGLMDDNGRPRKDCDLSKVQMYYSEDSTDLKQRPNPLDFCRWRYSPERNYTELILKQDSKTKINAVDGLCILTLSGPSGSIFCFYGVNETQRYGVVTLETPELEATFQLEFYK